MQRLVHGRQVIGDRTLRDVATRGNLCVRFAVDPRVRDVALGKGQALAKPGGCVMQGEGLIRDFAYPLTTHADRTRGSRCARSVRRTTSSNGKREGRQASPMAARACLSTLVMFDGEASKS